MSWHQQEPYPDECYRLFRFARPYWDVEEFDYEFVDGAREIAPRVRVIPAR